MKIRNKLERVVGITYVEARKDKAGFYIPYCRYTGHPGIISEEREETCRNRACTHYRRLYL